MARVFGVSAVVSAAIAIGAPIGVSAIGAVTAAIATAGTVVIEAIAMHARVIAIITVIGSRWPHSVPVPSSAVLSPMTVAIPAEARM